MSRVGISYFGMRKGFTIKYLKFEKFHFYEGKMKSFKFELFISGH